MANTPATPGLLLAIDTSGDVCSAAVFRSGRLAAELAFRHEMYLSERLIAHVDALLSGEGAALREVDCFAVGLGPGSFTGTRIGVMTAKTFAYIEGKPLVAINGLESMAGEYCGLPRVVVAPVLPCRGGVVYGGAYSVDTEEPIPILPPDAYAIADLCAALGGQAGKSVLFCGPAARRNEEALRAGLEAVGPRAAFGMVEFPRASSLGRLAHLRLASGAELPPPLEVSPLYISPPPITLPKRPIPT